MEPASLAYEGRLYAPSRSDLDFDQDAMYPCDVRWGVEELRRARELTACEKVRMVKEAIANPKIESAKGLTRASLVAPVVDRKQG